MAEITSTGSGHNKHHKQRTRIMPRVDLTPMVDLAFLLITFFMLTTELQHKKCIEWNKQVPSTTPEAVSECCVLNVLIDSMNRIYTYEGFDLKNLQPTSFSHTHGIEQVVIEKSKRVKTACGLTDNGKPHQMVCLIKLLPGACYNNLVEIMDDMETLQVKPYSLQDPSAEEIAALQAKEQELLAVK